MNRMAEVDKTAEEAAPSAGRASSTPSGNSHTYQHESILEVICCLQCDASTVCQYIHGGISIHEVNQYGQGALHLLYKRCAFPLNLYEITDALIKAGINVNLVDKKLTTPLYWLVLNANRGLRYHQFNSKERRDLDLLRPTCKRVDFERYFIGLDVRYQSEVLQTLKLLLQYSTSINDTHLGISPAGPHNLEWNVNFEHKLMTKDGRWKLLGFETSMESSTYNVFNSLSNHTTSNTFGLNYLHLAAWRGDASVIKQLLTAGMDANYQNILGRNALHYLYFHCNKPRDLPAVTELLLNAGLDPNTKDIHEHTPLYYLLRHVFVKKSYIKYLANAYSDYYFEVKDGSISDNFLTEILECIQILNSHGVLKNVDGDNTYKDKDTLLHKLFKIFMNVTKDTEKEFQMHGHYLVPYTFKIQPLSQFIQVLLSQGYQVNAVNKTHQTPLHLLAICLKELCLNEAVNPMEDIVKCYTVLLESGADPNIVDCEDNDQQPLFHTWRKTPALCLIDLQLQCPEPEVERVVARVLDVLVQYKADLTHSENGSTAAAICLVAHDINKHRYGQKVQSMHARLIEKLLQLGADPEQSLSQFLASDSAVNMHIRLACVNILCKTMNLSQLLLIRNLYEQKSAEQGNPDKLLTLMHCYCANPRSLQDYVRLALWRYLKQRYLSCCQALTLPTKMKVYLEDLVQLGDLQAWKKNCSL